MQSQQSSSERPIIPSEIISTLSSKLPILSNSLHGFHCQRGQLWLSDDEAQTISSVIQAYGFSFKVLPEVEQERKERLHRKSILSSLTREVHGPRLKRKTSTISQPSTELTSGPPSRHRRKSSSCGVSEKRRKRHKTRDEDQPTPGTHSSASIGSAFATNPVQLRQPTKSITSVPTRSSRRRREVLTGRWEDACEAVTSRLEAEPSSRWFLTPVDPEAEQVPDYLEKIKCPMDFQTIKQKLSHGMYTHPFRWQEDVRTIFYNAFTYHPQGNLIWNDAAYVANLFEQLCKEIEGVNPYAVYGSSHKRSSDSSVGSHVHEPLSKGMSRSIPIKGSFESSASAFSSPIIPEETFERTDTITLDASKLRELLERAASVAATQQAQQQATAAATMDSGHGIGKDRGYAGKGIGKGPSFWDTAAGYGSGKNLKHPPEPITSVSSSYNRLQLSNSSAQSQVRSLPRPTLPNPPLPPVAAAIRPGEKPPNIVHKRLVAAQFRDLDVHYRKAALELVKDELGIIPEVAAGDVNFKLDLELLPFLKQKQLLTYLRTLVATQRKKQEEGFSVVLVAHLDTPQVQPPSKGHSGQKPTSFPNQSYQQHTSQSESGTAKLDTDLSHTCLKPTFDPRKPPQFNSHHRLIEHEASSSSSSSEDEESSSTTSSSETEEEEQAPYQNAPIPASHVKSQMSASLPREQYQQMLDPPKTFHLPGTIPNTYTMTTPMSSAMPATKPGIPISQVQGVATRPVVSSLQTSSEVFPNSMISQSPASRQFPERHALNPIATTATVANQPASRGTMTPTQGQRCETVTSRGVDPSFQSEASHLIQAPQKVQAETSSSEEESSSDASSEMSSSLSEESSVEEEAEDGGPPASDINLSPSVISSFTVPNLVQFVPSIETTISGTTTQQQTIENGIVSSEETDDEEKDESPDQDVESSPVTRRISQEVKTTGSDRSSSWGEWKAKVIQDEVRRKMKEETVADVSALESESERAAESADAEI